MKAILKPLVLVVAVIGLAPTGLHAEPFSFLNAIPKCELEGMGPAQLNAFGRAFAAQMLGDHGASSRPPNIATLNAAVSKCAQDARLTEPKQAKALSSNVIDRLALRWAQLKLSADSGLPIGTVDWLLYRGLTAQQRDDIGADVIGDQAADALEPKVNALLGRNISDQEVELVGLAIKLHKRIDSSDDTFLHPDYGTVPFGKNGTLGCVSDGGASAVASCGAKWGWSAAQSDQAGRYAAARAQLVSSVDAALAALKAAGGAINRKECPVYFLTLLRADQEVYEVLFGTINPANRAALTRTGGTSLLISEAAARKLSASCYAPLGAWAAKPVNEKAFVAILRAIARVDAAETEFNRLSLMN